MATSLCFIRAGPETAKSIAILTVVVIIVTLGVARIVRSQRKTVSQPALRGTHEGLRNLALQSSRSQLQLSAPCSQTQPWGVIMDWGLGTGTATIVAFSDGSAGVYVSSGGGYIGGAGPESVRNITLYSATQSQAPPTQ